MLLASRRLVTLITILTLTAACGLAAGDSTQSRGGANHVGAAPEAVDFAAPNSLTLRFSGNVVSTPIVAEPLVVGGDIVVVGRGSAEVGGVGATVVAIASANGTPRWTTPLPQPVVAPPAYSDGRIIVGTIGGTLHCLRLTTGDELWQVTHQGYQTGAPVISGNTVVVSPGFGNDNLIAYDLASGNIIWTAPLSRGAQSSPAIFGNNVIVTLPDGAINNFSLATGLPLWANPIQTQGIFYGMAPCLYTDAGGNLMAMANPGGEEYATGSSVTGYRGYVAYRININTGTFSKIVPGRATVIAGAGDAGDGISGSLPGEEGTAAPNSVITDPLELLKELPDGLRQELERLNDIPSMISVVTKFEQTYGLEFVALKAALEAQAVRRAELDARPVLAESSTPQTNAVLPASSFSSAWVSSNISRPGPVSYLHRGTNEFLALSLREIPGETTKPRTNLFCMNPALGGTLRWYYSSTELDAPNAPGHPGTLFVPKLGDANGAWLIAPLGSNVAIFDAAGTNVPTVDIDMPGVVFATPVVSNGLLVLVDMSGHLRVYDTDNAAPSAPIITSPANGQDVMSGAGLSAIWTTSTDDADASNLLSYEIRYAVNGAWDTQGTTVALAANTLSYAIPAVPTDSDVQFAVRATDTRGAQGPWSAPVSFVYMRDSRAPLPPRNVVVTAGPLELRVEFDASLDEAPTGDADITSYRVQILNSSSGASFNVDMGLNHLLTVNGANASTPLIGGELYYVTIHARDHRDNQSVPIVRTATPGILGSVDTLAPLVNGAVLRDVNRDGRIDEVAVSFSEVIDLSTATHSGFQVGGVTPIAVVRSSGTELVLGFGSGIAGTGIMELTFDDTIGHVADLVGNTLVSFTQGDLVETDGAAPVLLMGTLRAWDDDGDTHPNRLTVDISEVVDAATVQKADLDTIRDSSGTQLVILSVSLMANGRTLEIILNDEVGTLTIPSVSLRDDGDGVFVADLNGNTFYGGTSLAPPTLVVTPGVGGRTIAPGLITLSAAGSSDPVGAGVLTVQWSVESWASQLVPNFRENTSTMLSSAVGSDASLLLVEPGLYAVRVILIAADGRSSSQLISISVLNAAPKANIRAPRSVKLGDSVTLWSGASSDANSSMNYQDLSTFAWRVTSWPENATPTLSNEDGPIAYLQGLTVAGYYEVELQLWDQAGAQSTATHGVQVLGTGEQAPLASAGPDRRAAISDSTIVSARFSRYAANATYFWEEVGSSNATLMAPESRDCPVTFPRAGVYTFRVTMVGPTGLWSSDDVVVEAFDFGYEYAPTLKVNMPTAVAPGQSFTMNFTGSMDVDGQNLSYEMRHVSGPELYAVAPNTYVTLTQGETKLAIRAFDGELYSMEQEVQILSTSQTGNVSIQAQVPAEVLTGVVASVDLTGVTSDDYWISQVGGPILTSLMRNGTALEFQAANAGMVSIDVWNDQASARIEIPVMREGQTLPVSTVSASRSEVNLERGNSFELRSSALPQNVSTMWRQDSGPSARIVAPTTATSMVELPNASASYRFTLLAFDGEFLVEAGSVNVTSTKAAPLPSQTLDSSGCSMSVVDSSLLGSAVFFVLLGGVLWMRRRKEDALQPQEQEKH